MAPLNFVEKSENDYTKIRELTNMKIVITGGTGFIGGHLIAFWLNQGHDIILVSRSKRTNLPQISSAHNVQAVTWNELRSNPALAEGADAIVNLAGSSINQRWTDAGKRLILQSRVDAAAAIADLVYRLERKPQVVVNASGMSLQGNSETDKDDENIPVPIVDFLSSVVHQWEQAADRIQGPRIVKVRVGLVLGTDGGAFPKMVMPYKIGVGGPIGSGKQWLSWIHILDMVRLIDFCITNKAVQGPINATAPNPVTNAEFGSVLAKVLHRPNIFPIPGLIMKLIFGELSVLLLEGQKVLPRKLLEAGFQFQFTQLEEALRDLLNRPIRL
jgi:uncharacterized protein